MSAQDLDEAIEASHAALAAISCGDVEPYMTLYSDAPDVTVGNPFGPFAVGKEAIRAAGERAASNYRDGEVERFDRVATHVVDGMACVVEVEHFTTKVGGSNTPTSISLRVTSLFRQEGGSWRLVHRHADPITTTRPAESVIGT